MLLLLQKAGARDRMICAVLEPEVIKTVGGALSPPTVPEIPCFSTISGRGSCRTALVISSHADWT